MKINEKTPDVVYNYANCLFNLNREEEAIKYYKNAIDIIKPVKR